MSQVLNVGVVIACYHSLSMDYVANVPCPFNQMVGGQQNLMLCVSCAFTCQKKARKRKKENGYILAYFRVVLFRQKC